MWVRISGVNVRPETGIQAAENLEFGSKEPIQTFEVEEAADMLIATESQELSVTGGCGCVCVCIGVQRQQSQFIHGWSLARCPAAQNTPQHQSQKEHANALWHSWHAMHHLYCTSDVFTRFSPQNWCSRRLLSGSTGSKTLRRDLPPPMLYLTPLHSCWWGGCSAERAH